MADEHNNEAFAYFYFNRNDECRSTPSAALRSLVRQLSVTSDGAAMQHVLLQLYRGKRRLGLAADRLHDDEAKQLLRQFADVYPQTTLVIDALDECDEMSRMSFVDVLESLVLQAEKPIKVFLSSRLDRDIQHRFNSLPNVAIRATDNAEDIAKFVEAEISCRLYWSQKISRDLREEIVRTLCDKSKGM